ncbi:MAG: tRNA (N6-isopentenyl adenosine(37)-C2)-methylthiotransferase MiaB [Oscillospiraceae bacterium]|nr:tRNA (N6-isopentenyl adenosine(37)-C2)-methylthiotransferase MiaB [Oscillospiraceae bacterium]
MNTAGKVDAMRADLDYVRRFNEEALARTGKKARAFTQTYGCQQNVSDGEKINGMLAGMGYDFCESPNEADIVIFNTCAIRENAEERVYGNVGALKSVKRRNPGMIIALCGCMMQQAHVAEKIKRSYTHVDLVFGPSALPELPAMIRRRLISGDRVFTILDETGAITEDLPLRRDGAIKAWVPIMYGCNNFCTYCVVPYVRGRERSRDFDKVCDEVRSLVGQGYREITLLGQNVNSYRSGDTDFVALLRALNAIEGDFRIRFMTSHPKDCTRALIDAIADCDKVCNHLHLPVQSGSDKVLEGMNRGYTVEKYLGILKYARARIPDITFTSDVIVGFPGETYADVQKTIDLIRTVRYQSLFTFIFSKREGTKAAEMADTVPDEEKKKWFSELLDIQNQISREAFESMPGETVTVLVDGKGKSGEGYLTGRTVSNMIVDFIGPETLTGEFVRVRITQALNWALAGELV